MPGTYSNIISLFVRDINGNAICPHNVIVGRPLDGGTPYGIIVRVPDDSETPDLVLTAPLVEEIIRVWLNLVEPKVAELFGDELFQLDMLATTDAIDKGQLGRTTGAG